MPNVTVATLKATFSIDFPTCHGSKEDCFRWIRMLDDSFAKNSKSAVALGRRQRKDAIAVLKQAREITWRNSYTGAACWDCAKNGHTCRPVPVEAHAAVRAFWDLNRQLSDADEEPGEVWRAAAQRAAQQLRACGSGAVPPPTPRSAPALASFGKVAERSFEERKLIALETIAGAAQLWIRCP
ncbi:hypothetical protein S40293_11410 [Stachybotrys chartarum IBT 40293]|nr:hypothetical protein S40293_11410 [Stachybotrys chartarum IBT 40293]